MCVRPLWLVLCKCRSAAAPWQMKLAICESPAILGTTPSPNKILHLMGDHRHHLCRHMGWQTTTGFWWTFLQNSFVNTETDFHGLYLPFGTESILFSYGNQISWICNNQEHGWRTEVGFLVSHWSLQEVFIAMLKGEHSQAQLLTCHNRITSLKINPSRLSPCV